MRIVRSTDNRHIGLNIELPQPKDIIDISGFKFQVQKIKKLDNGNTLIFNPNYLIECED